jgi:hypothetical protein
MSHLIFTLDFHEMVRGKLHRNEKCTIHYDPLRLASGKQGYAHGAADFEFTAFVEFKPGGSITVPLKSITGILENPVVMEDGRGSMLSGDFIIPPDTEEIIIWIALKDNLGAVTYDSDYGRNFHFRLFDEDVQITKATVENNKTSGAAKFTLAAASSPAVEKIIIRYRVTNGPDPLTENPVELLPGKGKKGQSSWSTGAIQVPFDAVVIYDLIYIAGGNKFKIENNGNYFIAHVKK